MGEFVKASAHYAAVLALTISSRTFACECFALDAATYPLDNYKEIFAGVVEAIEEKEVPTSHGHLGLKQVSFKVSQTWKGKAASTAQVYTGRGGPDCGFPFKVGQHYLVFAEPGESFYGGISLHKFTLASRCGLTRASENAGLLIQRLERERSTR